MWQLWLVFFLDIITGLCLFLRRAGLTEKSVSFYQAVMEVALRRPQSALRSFWDSGAPRFGESPAATGTTGASPQLEPVHRLVFGTSRKHFCFALNSWNFSPTQLPTQCNSLLLTPDEMVPKDNIPIFQRSLSNIGVILWPFFDGLRSTSLESDDEGTESNVASLREPIEFLFYFQCPTLKTKWSSLVNRTRAFGGGSRRYAVWNNGRRGRPRPKTTNVTIRNAVWPSTTSVRTFSHWRRHRRWTIA